MPISHYRFSLLRALPNHEDWKIGFLRRDFKDFSWRPAGEAKRPERQLFECISASLAFANECEPLLLGIEKGYWRPGSRFRRLLLCFPNFEGLSKWMCSIS